MKEITEDYVNFETAKLLREKGFDEKTSHVYYYYEEDDGWTFEKLLPGDKFDKNKMIHCPTQALAMKWLREVHNFHITAFPALDNDDGTKMSFEKWGESIDGLDGEYCMPISGPIYYNSYEEACEAAIKYVLENLI